MVKIAIVRRNGLGDLLCAYPLVLYIQKKIPDSSVTLFIDKRNAPLIPYLPPVEKIVVFPSKGNKYLNLYRTARRYRKTFDLAISAKTSPMKLMNFFLFWLKAKERIAYVDSKWHRLLVNRPRPFDVSKAKRMHQALKGLRTIAADLEDVPEELYPTLHIPEEKRRKYTPRIGFDHPLLLISATTTNPASRFDVDRYASIVNRLHYSGSFHVMIIGQKNDNDRASAIANRLNMSHSVHFPRNFDEFMVLLDASDLYFVGDGGIAHIGAALKKKEVVLYGQTNPLEWSPLSKDVETFFHPIHVDHLLDHALLQALKRKLKEVCDSGRNNL